MFTTALLTIAKTWKQRKCPSTDEWIKDVVYIHIHRYTQWNITQPLKKNEIRPFAATWTDMEITKVSEVSQARGGQISWDIACMQNLK